MKGFSARARLADSQFVFLHRAKNLVTRTACMLAVCSVKQMYRQLEVQNLI